jgi:hypothetical protein
MTEEEGKIAFGRPLRSASATPALLLSSAATAGMIWARKPQAPFGLPAANHDRNVACCSLVNATSAALIPARVPIFANFCN